MVDLPEIPGEELGKDVLKAKPGNILGLIAVMLVVFLMIVVYKGMEDYKELQREGNAKLDTVSDRLGTLVQIMAYRYGMNTVDNGKNVSFTPPTPTAETFTLKNPKKTD